MIWIEKKNKAEKTFIQFFEVHIRQVFNPATMEADSGDLELEASLSIIIIPYLNT